MQNIIIPESINPIYGVMISELVSSANDCGFVLHCCVLGHRYISSKYVLSDKSEIGWLGK